MRRMLYIMFLAIVLTAGGRGHANSLHDIIVLCYHDVPAGVSMDNFGVDRASFVNTVEYLRTHGFNFISLDDLIQARNHNAPLPPKPVLLTFDDAYASFYDFVLPVLREYQIPSVLAVVSQWLDKPPADVTLKLLTWSQLKEIARDPLVEIVSHSHDLHHGVPYNPQGNASAAAVSRLYDKDTRTYESDEAYNARILRDIVASKQELERHLNIKIRAIAWPYGRYNAAAVAQAKAAGIEINFSLNDKRVRDHDEFIVERYLVHKNPKTVDLMGTLGVLPQAPPQERAIQVDLDAIYDADPAQVERNLGLLLDRVKFIKPTAVYLQAFADPDGTGNVSQVYFPNTVLPMRMDLFNRVAHQLKARAEVQVYAWMPMLSFILPDAKATADLRVRSFEKGKIAVSRNWYDRLSPFSPEAARIIETLYGDLAKSAQMEGIIFQDDGYLTDVEDFHPDAKPALLRITRGIDKSPKQLTPAEKDAWAAAKTEALIKFSDVLMKAVRKHLPEAKFARTLYAPVLKNPSSEAWFAQNYARTLEHYDYTVIMAYPYMEDVGGNAAPWLRQLVRLAQAHPQGVNKTVFKIQAVNWKNKRKVDTVTMNAWLKALAAQGAHHLAYYPDDGAKNHPDKNGIRLMMSREDFPYRKDIK